MSKKKFTIGIIGSTKIGKTSTVSFLMNSTEQIREMSAGDENRTKSTIEYHADPNYTGDLMIEEIVPNFSKICGSDDGDIKVFNENLKNNPILQKVFKLHEIKTGEYSNAKDYVEEVINGFSNKVLPTSELKLLVNTEGIDEYLVRVVFKTGTQTEFGQFLDDNNIDLSIRDTRGLLDIVIEESTADMKIRHTKSLTALGLEGLDAIVFFCSSNYPNITKTIYEQMLSKLMKAIPVFLIYRDDLFKIAYNNFSKKLNYKDIDTVKHFIKDMHKDAIDAVPEYSDLSDEFFETLVFLSHFKITAKNSEGKYDFIEPYFNLRDVQFTLPNSKALKTEAFVKESEMAENVKEDYKLIRDASIATFIQIIENLKNLHNRMNNLLKDTKSNLYAEFYKLLQMQEIQTKIYEDFMKFNNGAYASNSPDNTRPVVKGMNTQKLNDDILDINVKLMGTRGGITTREHGSLKYPLTAVLGATASNWLWDLIGMLDTSKLLEAQNMSKEDKDTLIKKILRYVYLRRYVDQEASIDGYLLANRYKLSDKVQEIRNEGMQQDAFIKGVNKLIEEYNNTLQSMADIADVYIKEQHNM